MLPEPSRRSTPIVTPPRVWLLMGHKAGDNAQVQALAEALDWPFDIKHLAYRRYEVVPNLLLRSTLAGLAAGRSSPLQPPWPDLVIAAGRRNEPVARWIQARAAADGQRVRLVHLGRPWSRLARFDLIVTTPQYHLPDRPNILEIPAPLHRVNARRLREQGELWAGRFAHLPRPWIAVLIGGAITPYVFDDGTGRRLARQAAALVADGGSLLISTSPRTPPAAVDALCVELAGPSPGSSAGGPPPVPHYVFRWTRDGGENPFYGMLGLADGFIVTGDSMSMLAEACATGRPVHIFDLGEGSHTMRSTSAAAGPAPAQRRGPDLRFKALSRRLIKRLTPARLSRDIGALHRHFVDAGAAVWLGDPFPSRPARPGADGLAQAVARVRALFDPLPPPSPAARPE